MRDSSLHLSDLTRTAVGARAPTAVLVIPIGAVEQHGPHLPAGTDLFHTTHIAEEAGAIAAETTDIIVAPSLPYGSSEHHLPFGATLSLATETLYRALTDLTESAAQSGFRKVFLLNGHGGNHEIAQLVARDVTLRRNTHVAAGSWWAMAYPDLINAGAAEGGRLPGHAGRFETAVVASMRSHLVGIPPPPHDMFPPSDPAGYQTGPRVELHGSWLAIDGYTDAPGTASAAEGARWLRIAAEVVARHLVEFSRAGDDADRRASRRQGRSDGGSD